MFSLQSGFAGGDARGSRPASAHLRAFPPLGLPRAPHARSHSPPPIGHCPSAWCGASPRCGAPRAGRGRRFVAAAMSCRDATAVEESGTGARRAPETSGYCRSVHSRAGRKPPSPQSLYPLSSFLARVGSEFLHAEISPLDPLSGASKAPASSQPARWHWNGGKGKEICVKEDEFSTVFPIPGLPVAKAGDPAGWCSLPHRLSCIHISGQSS